MLLNINCKYKPTNVCVTKNLPMRMRKFHIAGNGILFKQIEQHGVR